MNKRFGLKNRLLAAALLASISHQPARPVVAIVPSKPANPQPKSEGIGVA